LTNSLTYFLTSTNETISYFYQVFYYNKYSR